MRVLVVGATGNVGTALVRTLVEDPAVDSVVGVARRSPDLEVPKVRWTTADIHTDELAPLLPGIDTVVHLAWLFQPTHDPAATWRANVGGTERLLDAVAESDVSAFVAASSIGAYSPGPVDRPVDESWPTHGWPAAGYCREKAYVERLLDRFERERPGCRVVRIRPGFIFSRESASQQRRLFAGPLLPGRLVRPDLLPVLPWVRGLRLQALHPADAAEAYRLATRLPVRGAFNIAADPVLDGRELAELLGARLVHVPARVAHAALSAAWHLHLVPAAPALFDAVLRLPVMDTERARAELGWKPRHSAVDAIEELLAGLREGAGGHTPPLATDAGGRLRAGEFASGVGSEP